MARTRSSRKASPRAADAGDDGNGHAVGRRGRKPPACVEGEGVDRGDLPGSGRREDRFESVCGEAGSGRREGFGGGGMEDGSAAVKRKRKAGSEAPRHAPAKKRLLATVDDKEDVTRSLPAGGRWWKPIQKERSSMVQIKAQPKTLSTSWERKLELRKKRMAMKEFEAELREEQQQIREKMKERRLAKAKRKAENELKNAKLQVLTKTQKIKKMSKKQLRSIMKTQMDTDGNVKLVPIYQ